MIESHDTKTWFAMKTAFIVLVGWVSYPSFSSEPGWILALALGVILAAYMWLLYRFINDELSLQRRAHRITQFAKGHGYTTASEIYPERTTSFRSVLGRWQEFKNQMQGPGWRYTDLSYVILITTNLGDINTVKVYYSVLELDLDRPLPHMLFDSPKAHGLAFAGEIDTSQKTTLEGDFDTNFVTYFPSKYHIDARSIISPEVMEAMIASGASDIEVIGRKLYLYRPLIPVERFDPFIEGGMNIRRKMMDHAMYYRDDRLDKLAQNKNDISWFGKNLMPKPKIPWLVLFAAFYILGVATLSFVDSGHKSAPGILAFILYVSVFVVATIAAVYRSWVKPRRAIAHKEGAYRIMQSASKERPRK